MSRPCLPVSRSDPQVVRRIREKHGENDLPVIMVSNRDGGDSVVEGLGAGCNDYVPKPFNSEELVARIRTHLRLRQVMKLQGEAGLLRRLLPGSIIDRMNRGEVIADAHENITVLFTDVCGFTEMCSRTDTSSVLKFLNSMFDAFDVLAETYGIYKVALIGDAYYAVSGHEPGEEGTTQATNMLHFAEAVLSTVAGMTLPGEPPAPVHVRVGMHCGPAYGGVVGYSRPQYTFLGDTVNIASRMESHGFPMCIHLSSGAVDQLVREGVEASYFTPCGLRDIKGKGKMITYLAKCGDYAAAGDALLHEGFLNAEY